MPDSFVAENTIINDSFIPDKVDSFVPDQPTPGQSGFANLINAGMDVIKDIPAQLQDLMNIPAVLLGTPRPPAVSKLSTETVPYLMEKATTPVGDITLPTLTYNDFQNIIKGKFTYTQTEISPTPIDIGFYGLMAGALTRNSLALARWNHQLNKLIKTDEVQLAVMDNMPAFESLMTQVGLKTEGMDLQAKTNFILNQAKESPKLGTAIMDIVKGKVVAKPITPTVTPEPTVTTPAKVEPVITPTAPTQVPVAPVIPTSQKPPVEPPIPPTPEAQGEAITPEVKIRGLARGVEEKAIENKLTSSFGDLPEYQTVNMKEQATKAQDLLLKDPEKARNIAMGNELAPDGILPESLFVAVENKAVKEGDVATLKDLAQSSGLTAEATTMGQRIRTLAERDPESPVTAINEVVKAREQMAQKRLGKETRKIHKTELASLKEHIKKTIPTKENWADFIRSIQC